jgi:hypothetical protein
MAEKGILEAAKERLGNMLSTAFSGAASPSASPAAAPAPATPSGPAQTACEKLEAQIEQQGGSVKAGQQRMAISCGLGGA